MTGKVKDWVTKGILTVIAGCTISLFTWGLARKTYSNDYEKEEIQKKIDKKLDKTVFESHVSAQQNEYQSLLKLIETQGQKLDIVIEYTKP